MTQAPESAQQPRLAMESLRSVLSGFIDPPDAWNPTVGLFIAGYVLAGVTIWGWFVGGWPLPLLLITGFLALHLE